VAAFSASNNSVPGGCDPRLLWVDGETERAASRSYLDVLKTRGLVEGRILLIAPPGHPFAAEAATRGWQIRQHATVLEFDHGLGEREEAFDACVVLYQLERAVEPLAILNRIHQALKPGGTLLLVPPSLDSWPAQFFRAQWTEWRPENLFYFDRSTLQSILLKSGFSGVWFETDKRAYTLQHISDRASACPRTALTAWVAFICRFVPSFLRSARFRLPSSRMIVTATRGEVSHRPKCSIVVPVYNERQTFPVLMDALLAQRLPGLDREIIVVESNSSDGTREIVQGYRAHSEVKIVLQERPRGKGNAVRTGFDHATGDVILIQDADLEYDLNDYQILLEPLLSRRALFVLGTRHGGSWKMRQFADQPGLDTLLNLGHLFFTAMINVLYRQRLTDPFTMFKVFYRDCLHGLEFECNRFDFDHELVIKLVRKGYRPLEIPVNYQSRSFKEGKKVRMVRDPLSWLWVDVKYRFVSLSRRQKPEDR
jgi:SAM-dependent methyltransferase